MIATGIDLGGTKIETQIFDQNWTIVEKRRVPTPTSYPELVRAICDEIQWARSHNETMPVGIGAAGLIDVSGRALTANLPATGHPIESDIQNAMGGAVYYFND
jgi:predicted NBD/HSP70 family sugar kinase